MKKWIRVIFIAIIFALPSFAIQSGLVVQDATITEADDGTSQIFFTVSISATSPEPFEVNFITSDGTAKEGIDYLKAAGSFTLQAGEQNHPVVVSVINDRRNLIGDKYFYLSIDSKILPLFRGKAKGVIVENDPPPPPSSKEHKKETKPTKTKGKS